MNFIRKCLIGRESLQKLLLIYGLGTFTLLALIGWLFSKPVLSGVLALYMGDFSSPVTIVALLVSILLCTYLLFLITAVHRCAYNVNNKIFANLARALVIAVPAIIYAKFFLVEEPMLKLAKIQEGKYYSNSPQKSLEDAKKAMAQGRNLLAISALDNLLRLKPDFADGYALRGSIRLNFKELYNEALQDFNQAITLTPYNGTLYNNRALIYYNAGNYEQALQDANLSIELQPDDANHWNTLGLINTKLKKYETAETNFDKAVSLDKKAQYYYHKALVYIYEQQYDNALKTLTQAKAATKEGDPMQTVISQLTKKIQEAQKG